MLRLSSTVFVSTIALGFFMFTEVKSASIDSSSPANSTSQVNCTCSQLNCSSSQGNCSCPCVQVYTFRFTPGTEVKSRIESIVRSMNFSSASIVSGLGNINRATLRFVAKSENKEPREKTYDENMNINALSGTFGPSWSHLHAVLSRYDGTTVSGGVQCLVVYNSVEVVLEVNSREEYSPVFDRYVGDEVLNVEETGSSCC